MTYVEFLTIVEEFDLPANEKDMFRLWREVQAADAGKFRETLREQLSEAGRVWVDDNDDALTDGCGNRWIKADTDD